MDQEKIGTPLKGSNRAAPTSSFRLGRRNLGARDGKTKEGAERLRKAREIRKNIGEDYMGMHNEVTIDEDIHPYLNEIAERLWSSHAAIMIGAGFSKNANPNFPNWETLGDLFFEKIHGRKPNKEKGKDRYLNVLKLADEVEAAFGRPTLDQLLRDHIPDNDSEPSDLHTKMLELPWSDVFTTNYDTLLERARDSISS